MRKIFLLICIMLTAALTKAQDYSKIAPEYCNCYSTIEDSIPSEFIRYILEASNSPQFNLTLFQSLSLQGKEFSSNGFHSWNKLKMTMADPQTDIGKCASKLNTQYLQYINNEDERKIFYLGILSELEKENHCGLYVAYLRSLYR